jgi:hypothetical protein
LLSFGVELVAVGGIQSSERWLAWAVYRRSTYDELQDTGIPIFWQRRPPVRILLSTRT